MIKKSSILKDSSSIQDKQDDYNSRPNSSIPQDSCIIIINFFFCNVIFKFFNEHSGAAIDCNINYGCHVNILHLSNDYKFFFESI